MRKANKILMATVAILLCLVLISTSVVSGVFARFVITQTTKSEITFGNFGVNVTMTPSTELNKYVKTNTTRGESATMAFEGIPLRPGTDFSDAVNIKFEGIPNVKVKVILLFHIDYNSTDTANTTVPVGIGGNDDDTRYFMPLGFTFGAKEANGNVVVANGIISNPWKNSVEAIDGYQATHNGLEQSIRMGIKKKLSDEDDTTLTFNWVSDSSDYGFSFIFDPNSTTAATKTDIKNNGIHFHAKDSTVSSKIIKQFELGFVWPEEYTDPKDKYDYDVIGTYLAQNADETKPIKIWYTVKLEQVD